jgi:hypothetical protein
MSSFYEVVVDLDDIPSTKVEDVKGMSLMDKHTTIGKTTSPNEESKEECINLQIKLLKRAIKIEKI